MKGIKVSIGKSSIPIIFLDSNIIIEMKRAMDGHSSCKYAKELIELYNTLQHLMKRNLIYCPVGSQHEEIGLSGKKQSAEEFFQRLANSELKEPIDIKNLQLSLFYQAYENNLRKVALPFTDAFSTSVRFENYKIRVVTKYGDDLLEEIRYRKEHTVELLNALRDSGTSQNDFIKQLCIELTSEAQVLKVDWLH